MLYEGHAAELNYLHLSALWELLGRELASCSKSELAVRCRRRFIL